MVTTGHGLPYEQRLRTIGARLDSGGYHSASIIEAEGGLIVRASAPGSRTPEVLEVAEFDGSHAAQLAPMRGGVPHRLFPNGYKGFLTALGRLLDRSEAAAIVIVEVTDFVTVGGIQPVAEESDGTTYEPLDILLLAEDIRALIAKAEAVLEFESAQAMTINDPAVAANDSIVDAVVHRISTAVDSMLRVVSSANNPARSRG
jgi:hypothetical protein